MAFTLPHRRSATPKKKAAQSSLAIGNLQCQNPQITDGSMGEIIIYDDTKQIGFRVETTPVRRVTTYSTLSSMRAFRQRICFVKRVTSA
jgi:hypothetical protein